MRAMRCVIVCLLIGAVNASAQDQPPPATLFDEVLRVTEDKYLSVVPRKKLEERALRAFLQDLDPYSWYYNAEEWELYEAGFRAQFAGVGITMRIDPESKFPVVDRLMLGSAGGAAGMRAGDTILNVDGRSLAGLDIDQIIPHMRGEPGSQVVLTIRHAGSEEEIPLTITRKVFVNPTVRGARRDAAGNVDYMLDSSSRIGYIRILMFGDDTVAGVEGALRSLKRQKMRGLVLDLRDSMGGQMQAALKTADFFLDSGRMLSVVQRNETEFFEAKKGTLTDVPMVMLINGNTASSSEILAGALADQKRAIVMGERTFGKGRVQEKIALPEGMGGVVVSTGTFHRPSGKTIDKHDAKKPEEAGIAPDPGMEIVLEKKEYEEWERSASLVNSPFQLTPEELATPVADRVLERAREVLLQHIK